MSIYLSNRDGNGKTNEEGHYRLQTKVLKGQTLGTTALKVVETSPLSLGVYVQPGDYRLETTGGWAYTGWIDTNATVTFTTADPANPRVSSVVLYIDKGATTSASPPNNPGIAKLMAVNGTAAAAPVAPTGSAIQTAVGAGNPYMVLAEVTVGTAATQVTNSNIVDKRTPITLDPQVLVGADLLGAISSTQLKTAIGPLMYPVGSLYFNGTVATNPATLLGFGTWVQYAAGQVPVGFDSTQTEFDTLEETGGSKTHWHWQTIGYDGGGYYMAIAGNAPQLSAFSRSTVITVDRGTFGSGHSTAGARMDGTGDASSLMPYITVRIWKRTA